MWNNGRNPARNGQRLSKSAPCSPLKPLVKKVPARADSFHVVHKVPVGDTPYVRAKHVQLVDKDPERAIALFWAAINANDRVDSALKDMAIVMKQQNRPEEAIEAIKSLRNRCSDQAQESLDNVLLDLYKRCGRIDDQIALLKHKLTLINQGLAFNGKRTKTARSQGKKFQVSIEQEATRLLGNLGWAYMQQCNYVAAEAVYRKALAIQPDNNKVCNLGICLMNQGRVSEAKSMLQTVEPASANGPWGIDSHLKSYERAQEMLRDIESQSVKHGSIDENSAFQTVGAITSHVWQSLPCPPCPWTLTAWDQAENQKPNSDSLASVATTFLATSGFGPIQQRSSQQKGISSALDENAQFSMFSTALWELKTEEEGFGDENMNVNINNVSSCQVRAPFGFTHNHQSQQSHAEVLRQKLEKVCLKENNGNAKRSFLPQPSAHTEHVLNSVAPPFFSKSSLLRDKEPFSNGFQPIRNFEERLPLTLDRTNEQKIMSYGGNGAFALEGSGLIKNAAQVDPISAVPTAFTRGNSIVNENRPATRRSLSFESIDCGLDLPPLPKQQTTTTTTKNNSVPFPLQENALDQWDSLGFTECPDNKDFEQAITSVPCESSNSGSQSLDNIPFQQHKCQGRLRVFQEMTLPASPKA